MSVGLTGLPRLGGRWRFNRRGLFVVADAANLISHLGVEGMLLKRLNGAGTGPRIGHLAHVSFASLAFRMTCWPQGKAL